MAGTGELKLYCCGSRGSRSIEGSKFNEFGGYTSCYILKKDDYALVLDCGTGFYAAGPILANCSVIDIILTHMHYDHILGFLDWGMLPKNAHVTCYGGFDAWFGEKSIEEFFKRPFWPVTPAISIKNAPKDGDSLKLHKNISASFYSAPHPDGSKLLIIKDSANAAGESKIVIMFDCEKSDGLSPDLIKDADILIYDGMYDDSEYVKHVGWGHSTWQEGVRLAEKVQPKRLIITHHEPDRTDEDLNKFEDDAREKYYATDFARAGQMWSVPPAEMIAPSSDESKTKKKLTAFGQEIKKHAERITNILLDRKKLIKVATTVVCALLSAVALFMTIVNISTGKHSLMLATAIFSILSLVNFVILMLSKNEKVTGFMVTLFQIEMVVLFSFFIVSGTPEGFSIIWILLLPTAGLFVFGRERATLLCAVMLGIMLFFFQTKLGNSLLMFDYSDSYKLRFPMAFVAFFLISFFLETVRNHTLDALEALKAEQDEKLSRQTSELRDQNLELISSNSRLEMRNDLLNKTFGRFLPDEVVSELLDTREGFELYGDKVIVTALQSDIRGFTALSADMDALNVVNMLNNYLGCMTGIIQKHNGTVVEFIGDGIFALFGAPNPNAHHADDAIACAVEMQAVMKEINEWNTAHGYSKFEIGIGIHTGEAVVGTIGSEKHLKYDAIGNTINLGSRIESYSTGRQILVSQETIDHATAKLDIDKELSVMPKGVNEAITLSSVTGIGAPYNVSFNAVETSFEKFAKPVDTNFVMIYHDHCEFNLRKGAAIAESKRGILLRTSEKLNLYDNIRFENTNGLTGKVIEASGDEYEIRYTSVPDDFKGFCATAWS